MPSLAYCDFLRAIIYKAVKTPSLVHYGNCQALGVVSTIPVVVILYLAMTTLRRVNEEGAVLVGDFGLARDVYIHVLTTTYMKIFCNTMRVCIKGTDSSIISKLEHACNTYLHVCLA